MGLLSTFLPGLLAAGAAGVLLAVVLWVAGLAWLDVLRPEARGAERVHAYPLGLLAVLVVAVGWLVAWPLGVLLAAGAAAPLGRRGARDRVGAAGRACAAPVVCMLPFALGFGVVLGLYDHGPTATRDSHAFGDLIWWIARGVSAHRSPLHLPDLALAGYAEPAPESGAAYVHAVLHGSFGVDPFFVYTTALPVLMLVSVAVCLRLLGRPVGTSALGLGLVLSGATVYSSWLAESPPVTLAAPLAFSLLVLLRDPMPLRATVAIAAALCLALAETKIIGLACAAPLLVVALVRHHGTRLRGRGGLVVLACGAVATVGAFALLATTARWTLRTGLEASFLPTHVPAALRLLLRQHTLAGGALPALLAAEVLLAVQCVRRREVAGVGLAAGVGVSWVVSGQNFSIAARLGICVAALALALRADATRLDGLVLVACGSLLVASGIAADTAEIAASATLGALLGTTFVVAATGARVAPWAAAVAVAATLLALGGHGVAAIVLGLAAAWAPALAGGHVPRRAWSGLAVVALLATAGTLLTAQQRGLGTYDLTVLPHDSYDIWRRVAQTTPRNALVLTTLTGPGTSVEEGWNYYPALGGRQLLVAGWVYSEIGVDSGRRFRRLTENAAVFAGEASPEALPEARRHPAFYAVMWANQPHPKTFRELYANHLFVLYGVPRGARSTTLVMSFDCPTYTTCRPLRVPRVVAS